MNKTWIASTAKWIWLVGEEKPANAYTQFRKSFTLDTVPTTATVHVTADCRYLLYVNGRMVGRGPVATPPKFKQVDVYDVVVRAHDSLAEGRSTGASRSMSRSSRVPSRENRLKSWAVPTSRSGKRR